MKKIISAFLILPILFSCFLLCGCADKDLFWEDTYKSIKEFKENKNNSFLFNDNLVYSDFIENSAISYTLKNIYGCLSKNLLYEFNANSKVFSLKPLKLTNKNNSNIKKAYENLEKSINSAEKTINNFLESKKIFEETVYEKESSSFAKQKIREFEKEYAHLIYSLERLNIDFNKAFKLGYQSLPSCEKEFLQDTYIVSLSKSEIINQFCRSFINSSLLPFNGVFDNKANTNFLTKANELTNQNLSKQTTYEKYKEWQEFYNVFKVEESHYNTSLNKINYAEYLSDKSAYIENKTNEKVYLNTINEFEKICLDIMFDKTLALNYQQ